MGSLALDRGSDVPLFEQLCQLLRKKMTNGDLQEGQRLPPTRALATELGVSRMTVVNAYEQLVAEGYLLSKVGSGHQVAGIGEIEHGTEKRAPAPSRSKLTLPARETFRIGRPDMRLFPRKTWTQTVARVCRNAPDTMLTCDDPFGSIGLREAVAQHVSQWRGISASPDQIIITPGATDGLELCLRALSQPGQMIALENPGYQPVRHIAQANGQKVQDLAIDDQGAVLPGSRTPPHLAVITPSHQFPLGGAMTAGRRRAFKDWAVRHQSWIIEDDYDSEFRFSGQPIPAMASFEQGERMIYVGSFSKIFSNALRIGYLIAPANTLDAFKTTIGQFRSKASLMPQQPLAEFIHSGNFYRHLRRVRRIYAERRTSVLNRLARDFTDLARWTDHNAGMHIALKLDAGASDVNISRKAAQHGLCLSPLSDFSPGNSTWNGLALGYCADTEEELADGLKKLRDIIAGELR